MAGETEYVDFTPKPGVTIYSEGGAPYPEGPVRLTKERAEALAHLRMDDQLAPSVDAVKPVTAESATVAEQPAAPPIAPSPNELNVIRSRPKP